MKLKGVGEKKKVIRIHLPQKTIDSKKIVMDDTDNYILRRETQTYDSQLIIAMPHLHV